MTEQPLIIFLYGNWFLYVQCADLCVQKDEILSEQRAKT